MRIKYAAVLGLLICAAVALGGPRSADAILKEAQSKAKAAKKNILVMFDASW